MRKLSVIPMFFGLVMLVGCASSGNGDAIDLSVAHETAQDNAVHKTHQVDINDVNALKHTVNLDGIKEAQSINDLGVDDSNSNGDGGSK